MEYREMETRFSHEAEEILRKAGWLNGRKATQAAAPAIQLDLFPKAQEVLSEFGGLHIGECGPGIDCATSDVNISPDLCVHLDQELTEHSRRIGKKLFPLGEVHRGHGYLVIDEDGKAYLLSDELELHADTFWESLEALVLGKRVAPKPHGAEP
jgi:hypothetical protein